MSATTAPHTSVCASAPEDHHGVIYSYDDTLPRHRAAFPLWVSALERFLEAHPVENALMNRVHHLLP